MTLADLPVVIVLGFGGLYLAALYGIGIALLAIAIFERLRSSFVRLRCQLFNRP